MSRIRPPAVAGLFYENDPRVLDAAVHQYLADGLARAATAAPPKALIVPHAGFVYSGPVAGTAYATLLPLRDRIRRVILLGPAHHVFVRGLATSSADAWDTPLGRVAIDRAAVARVGDLPGVQVMDEAHAEEHSLEVQLPFLQVCLDDFALVPFAVGDARAADVADVLDALWGGDETLMLISSDLSHYLDYDAARISDRAAADAITALDPAQLDEDMACGRIPVRGLLTTAKRRGMQATLLDLRNSGDTAGPRDRVVGYGAFALS